MINFEHEIVETEQLLDRLVPDQRRELERTLRDLTPEQRTFARGILQQAKSDASAPQRYLHMIEHFIERWSSHGLAVKMVIINRLSQLATSLAAQRSDSEKPRIAHPFPEPADLMATA